MAAITTRAANLLGSRVVLVVVVVLLVVLEVTVTTAEELTLPAEFCAVRV